MKPPQQPPNNYSNKKTAKKTKLAFLFITAIFVASLVLGHFSVTNALDAGDATSSHSFFDGTPSSLYTEESTPSSLQQVEMPPAGDNVNNTEPASSSQTAIHHHQVTFKIEQGGIFTDGSTLHTVALEAGLLLTEQQVPQVLPEHPNATVQGWYWQDELFTSQDLLALEITDDFVFTSAIQTPAFFARATNDSIQGIVQAADTTKVNIIPGTDGSTYQPFPGTEAGLRSALYELYLNGAGQDYILHLGTSITASTTAATHLGRKTSVATSPADVTFASLTGKVGKLVLTGSTTDPVTHSTNSPAGATTFSLNTSVFLGTNMALRNMRYNFANIYAMGYSLTLDRGSYETGTLSIYGGVDSGNISGNPVIIVNATGAAADYHFYGGNQTGTLTGNSTIIINDTFAGIGSVYGGGYGTSAANPAHVLGNVSTTINGISGSFNTYFGGVNYGNISGSITNIVRGKGVGGVAPAIGTTSGYIFGGSNNGNIGTDATLGSDVITTTVDTSAYSSGWRGFTGANNQSGIVKGNIVNTVTAGDYNAGSIQNFNGGGGFNTMNSSASNNSEAGSPFKIYGNITSTLPKGCFSNGAGDVGYTKAAGFGGYVQGNVTIEIGTEGLAYGNNHANISTAPSTTNKTRGINTGWDIVGGGALPSGKYGIYVKGDTRVILRNVLARWTYGGGFGGTIIGNTNIELHNGVVDTLEGAGYDGLLIRGNTSAYVYGGQVDWFLSGGGWDDDHVDGNAYVEVNGGTINASMGGTYGASSAHTISGNATILVKGGNFSGTPRDGPNGFSGGATNLGSILGNSSVTLDLRGTQTAFQLPIGTSISGGRRPGAGTILGTNASNTVNLAIFTDPGNDVLNGANIYGDAGANPADSREGKITIDVNAPGSSIGNLYATEYGNTTGATGSIRKDVVINVIDAKSINGINGGAAGDNFTDTIVANSPVNRVAVNVGPSAQPSTISIGSLGLLNFTNLIVDGNTLMAGGTGSIKNGNSATQANHGSTYRNFGNITLKNGGGIGIAGSSPVTTIISGAKLSVVGESQLISPAGAGRVNITSFEAANSGDRLNWVRNGGAALVASNGTWFGAKNAYQVLTFSPTINNATALTPANFKGIDQTTRKTYLGDNDVTKATYGYGIALPGSIVEFEVVEGNGNITHNMDNVSQGPPPPALIVYGSVTKDSPVQKGMLAIPLGVGLPTLTFTPDATSGSWVKGLTVVRSDDATTTLGESTDVNPVTWTSDDGEYSYTAQIRFKNDAELTAESAIITQSEAAVITEELMIQYNKASGRPFFANNSSEIMLNEIRAPLLPDEYFRVHPVTYRSGDPNDASNYLEMTVNIVVVRDGATFPADPGNRSAVLYAQDATLRLAQAQALTGQAELDASHTHALVILADGTTQTPGIDAAAVTEIQTATQPKNVAVAYTHNGSVQLQKTVIVHILPDGVQLSFYKVSAKDTAQTLAGAEFVLYTCEQIATDPAHVHEELVTDAVVASGICWQPALDDVGAQLQATSQSNGHVDFGLLEDGIYVLVETKAPAGYEKPIGQWTIQIDSNQTGAAQISITSRGEHIPPAFGVDGDTLLLPNMPQFAMPTSGAQGTFLFTLLGTLLIALAITLFFLKKKKHSVYKNFKHIRQKAGCKTPSKTVVTIRTKNRKEFEMKKSFFTKLLAVASTVIMGLALTAAPVLAATDLPDPAQTASVTVHKYATASPSQTPGTGLELSSAEAAALGTPLAGVGFTLYAVSGGFTMTADTTVEEAKAAASSLGEKMTDANGIANWEGLTIGYYVLEETTPPAGNFDPAAPAIISLPMGYTGSGSGWNYDVHVYPKNVKTDDISKEVSTTLEHYNVGDTVSWVIDGKIKSSLRAGAAGSYTYGNFSIVDALDSRLTYTDNSDVLVAHGGTTAPLALVRGIDYTATQDAGTNTVTWSLTQAGMDKVSDDNSASIRVTFDTTINQNATAGTPAGSPSISNGADLTWENGDGTNSGTATIDEANKPTIALSGIEISKVDSVDNTILLDGAQFKIASNAANAQAGIYIKSGANPSEDLIITTGDNSETLAVESGWAMFTGLPLNDGADTDFYLVETQAPTGYLLRQSIIKVTVPSGQRKANAVILNQKVGNPPIDEDKPTFQLPQTGGIGTILFTVVGVSLIAGALILLVKTRKKKSTENSHKIE